MRPRRLPAILGLCVAILASIAVIGSAAATTLLKLDLDGLVKHSELIVAGRVSEIKSAQEHGRIFTYISVEVSAQFKGAPTKQVTFRQLGGRFGELVTYVPGQADFEKGEQVLIFLERPSPGVPLVVTGMAQGKFKLEQAPNSPDLYVSPDLGHTPLVEPTTIKDGDTLTTRLRQAAPSADHLQISTYQAFTTRLNTIVKAQQALPAIQEQTP